MTQDSLFGFAPEVTTSTPPPATKPEEVAALLKGATHLSVESKPPQSWYTDPGEYGSFQKVLECGRSYLVGNETPMPIFLRSYTTSMEAWQKKAFAFACENQDKILHIHTKTRHWQVFKQGEYVEFSLPHQDFGGEKSYISIDGKTKVLVNVD